MTYKTELEYKQDLLHFVFYYTPKEQREFDMADSTVGWTVSYRTFADMIAPNKINKLLLLQICLRLLQEHLDGVACMLQPFLQLIVDIPNPFTEEEEKIYKEVEKRFNGWRYNIYE